MEDEDVEWLSVDETAQFLKVDREEVEQMMRQRLIPHTLLPLSRNPIFSRRSLDKWLRDREVSAQGESGSPGVTREALLEMLLDRIHAKSVNRSRYINLYTGTKVFAQLHEPAERKKTVYDGICLAIPEATSYDDRPKVEFLQPVEIRDLQGYWKANKDWLEGNGHRFKEYKAMAYHIPLRLAAEPNHPGWSEVDELLRYALRKLEGKKASPEEG